MVGIKGKLYFAPDLKFDLVKWNDKEALIKAFEDRINGFYLGPSQKLCQLNKFYAFAAGVLCVSTIDCLAMISISPNRVGDRFKQWTQNNIAELNQSSLASRFYEDFRNGLVHEGRIKKGGQFSFETDNKLLKIDEGVMIINPDILIQKINYSFNQYIRRLKTNSAEFQNLQNYLEKFDTEIENAKS